MPEGTYDIGKFGRLHLKYLKKQHRASYIEFLTSGKLYAYLHDIDIQAQEMFNRLVKEYAEWQGVTEQLKSENQMEWVGRMNNIRNVAEEVVLNEIIYK